VRHFRKKTPETQKCQEHKRRFTKMNAVLHPASGRVQCVAFSVLDMIDEGRPSGRSPQDPKEETIMFKTISAALLAVSVLAAPALASTSGKTDIAPTKQAQVKTSSKVGAKSTGIKSTGTKSTGAKSSVLNANAKMGSHHTRHHKHHRHLSQHKAGKTHTKVSLKQAKPSTKRG
jgi:hypothetical protein